jgi:hypothetical protein
MTKRKKGIFRPRGSIGRIVANAGNKLFIRGGKKFQPVPNPGLVEPEPAPIARAARSKGRRDEL